MQDEVITFVAASNGPTDLVVRLGSPRPGAYSVTATLSGVANAVAIDIPQALRTIDQFTAITTAPLSAGDRIDFHVFDRPGGRRIPPARVLVLDGILRGGARPLQLTSPDARIEAPFALPSGARVTEVEATVQAFSNADTVQLMVAGEIALSSGTAPQTLKVDVDLRGPAIFPPRNAVAVLSLSTFSAGAQVLYVFATLELDV